MFIVILTFFTSKKRLGQHFLTCDWVTDRILDAAAVSKEDTVLEIGPGNGALTFALAAKAGRIIAVEKDENLARRLAADLEDNHISNVSLLSEDIRKMFTDRSPELDRHGIAEGTYIVVANIPYYLTSYLFRLLLEQGPRPREITVMIQKEVAQRAAAAPPHMNLLALSVQTHGSVQSVTSVPAHCFQPKPNVDSEVIRITEISDEFFRSRGFSEKFFFTIIKQAFSGKRKFLVNTLSRSYTKESLLAILSELGIPAQARPQELSIEQWGKLATRLQKIWVISPSQPPFFKGRSLLPPLKKGD